MVGPDLVRQNQPPAPSTGYGVWKSDGNVVPYVPYDYPDTYRLEHRLWNAHFVHRSFDRYWHYSIAIVAVYVCGIYLLQRWMRDRKPFVLREWLTLWNTTLAVFSTFGAWRFGEEFFHVMKNRTFEDSICLSVNPQEVAAFWAMCFALSKVAELMDTVFLVLRKRPLIFLHWYHHAVVLVYVWHSAVGLTAPGRWFIFMNYAVHSIMYTYYAIASTGLRLPRYLAMTVTTLQTSQMLVGVAISVYVAYLKRVNAGNPEFICQQTDENLMICFGIYVSFAFLFMRFFVKSYLTKRAPSQAVINGKKVD